MYFILSIGIFEALFLGILLLFKKNKSKPDYILASYFFLLSISILFSYLELYNSNNNYIYPGLIHITSPLLLLHGPILWLYIKSLTSPDFKFKTIYVLHFIPFLSMYITLTFNYYIVPGEIKIPIVKSEAFKEYFYYKFYVILIALSIYFYLGWCLILIRNYKKKILNIYSHIEKIDLNWLRFLFIIAIVLYGLAMTINLLDLFLHFIKFQTFQTIAFILASIFILVLGFFGIRQTNIFASIENISNIFINKSPKILMSKNDNEDNEFIQRLLAYMQNEKPFIDHDINIARLANKISVTPEYLSQILNEKLNKNFFDFINSYRIEEFKNQLQNPDNKNLTLIGIAYDCGFSSKATFNRVFKNYMHITPSQYKILISNN